MPAAPAVYGPPWRVTTDPRGVLFADPPAPGNCRSHLALAAFSPSLSVLVRGADRTDVERRARALAERGDGRAYVLQGAIQTAAGRWLWPVVVDRVATAKADPPDPLTRRGYALTVEELRGALQDAASPAERRALEAMLSDLDEDWGETGLDDVEAAVAAAGRPIESIGDDALFLAVGLGVIESTAASVAGLCQRAGGSGLPSVLTNAADRVARHIGRDGLAFVTDEYRRRMVGASRDARRVIAGGVRDGLGRVQIGRDLRSALHRQVVGRSEAYYRVVAGATVSRARSFGQMTGYRDAGIPTYTWEAVLDARTCDICRFLHGQTFPVADALARFDRSASNPNPEAAVNEFAWYRTVGGSQIDEGLRGGGAIFVSPRGEGPTVRVATVTATAVGTNDQRGAFRTHVGAARAGGTTVPPAHGGCRCTTIPTR